MFCGGTGGCNQGYATALRWLVLLGARTGFIFRDKPTMSHHSDECFWEGRVEQMSLCQAALPQADAACSMPPSPLPLGAVQAGGSGGGVGVTPTVKAT